MTSKSDSALYSRELLDPTFLCTCFGLFVFLAGTLFVLPAAAQSRDAAEIRCLALTIYFEARGEPAAGKIAVGHVVMNRVLDPAFPGTVCGVVHQGGDSALYRCQFTWWCDGLSDQPKESASWRRCRSLARLIYDGYTRDPTESALWYHADYVAPSWAEILVRGPTIGRHVFYARPEAPAPRPPQSELQLATADSE